MSALIATACAAALKTADACWSTGPKKTVPKVVYPDLNINNNIVVAQHKPCEPPWNEMHCFNGGSCTLVEWIPTVTVRSCICPEDWSGKQCELRFSIERTTQADQMQFATFIVAIVLLFIVLALFLLVAYYCYVQKRTATRQLSSEASEVGIQHRSAEVRMNRVEL